MKPVFVLALAFAAALNVFGFGGKEKAPVGNPEILISCYDSMAYRNFLEDAARLFQEQNPGTTVRIETFSSMPEIRTSGQGDEQMILVQNRDDPQGRSDYTSRVNTGLMSGAGADIFAMDVLPLHKLVESGQLENLETMMNSDASFNKMDYRENILSALKYHNGIWIMPMDYSFRYFAYDSTLLPAAVTNTFGPGKFFGTEALLKIGETYFTGSNRIFSSNGYTNGAPGGGGMFTQIINEYIASFVDLQNKRASFTDGVFSGILESVKKYGEMGYIPPGLTMQQGAEQRLMQGAAAEADRYFFKWNDNFHLFSQFTRGIMNRRMLVEGGYTARSATDHDEIAGIEVNADGTVPFEYSRAFAINSRSKNKELAWAFIKFLLSEDMQLSTAFSPSSLPLHNSARSQKAELLFSGAFMGRGEPLDANQRAALEKYIAAVETLSDRINSFTVRDTLIDDTINAEAQYFFNGSRTAAEVARVLQGKVDLYLNE
jgi:multiple sugar transport system substrate-binding protein